MQPTQFLHPRRSFLGLLMLAGLLASSSVRGQVFVVGEKSATADLKTDFNPTALPLPPGRLSERGVRELMRQLVAEQGFAHRALPLGAALTLQANGPLTPGPEGYKKLIYEKGQAAAAGDRVSITALEFKSDRIIVDVNGGPYLKHRFLRHVSLNGASPASDDGARATGSRVTLVFEGGVPDISAPEVKALLEPVLDFGVKSAHEAYADTLPAPLKSAIESHEVLVGMNHRMVLAALGAPESKIREHDGADVNGPRYEEWIYGHVPQTVRFIRFQGDSVSVVKIAALGQPVEVHDQNELAGYLPPVPTREISMGDAKLGDPEHPAAPPSLRRDGDAPVSASTNGQVQYPTSSKRASVPASPTPAAIPPTQ